MRESPGWNCKHILILHIVYRRNFILIIFFFAEIALELQFGGKPLVEGGFEVHGSCITFVVVTLDDIIVTGVTQ